MFLARRRPTLQDRCNLLLCNRLSLLLLLLHFAFCVLFSLYRSTRNVVTRSPGLCNVVGWRRYLMHMQGSISLVRSDIVSLTHFVLLSCYLKWVDCMCWLLGFRILYEKAASLLLRRTFVGLFGGNSRYLECVQRIRWDAYSSKIQHQHFYWLNDAPTCFGLNCWP
jgi:hypothetical protein